MPLPINDAFDIPSQTAHIRVALEPARAAVESLLMLTRGRFPDNASDWVTETYQAMTPEEHHTNNLVMLGLHYVVLPTESWPSFPAYVDHLEAMQPEALRDKMLNVYESFNFNAEFSGEFMDRATALSDPENYLAYLRQHFRPESVDEAIEREAYRYVSDPPALQRLVVDHLRHMWRRYLAGEWERIRPTLQSIVNAYAKVDFKDKTYYEATRMVTGQDLDMGKWEHIFNESRRLIFVPHLHVGPYIPKCICGSRANREVTIFFNAHLPDWMEKETPELTRTEIAIRLSALADDTRLRILRDIAEHGERRSQDIMEALDLSQSATSRHLSQLSAGGFITERRCDGAKCYTLNPERLSDTLQAIASFLLIQERNKS